MGNFHGNASDGERGLKPVDGEAATIFAVMQQDQAERERLVALATTRLDQGKPAEPISLPARIARSWSSSRD